MSTALYLTPKMGLIPEVSAQNYGSLAKALREYVSNALDASANNVWITFSADLLGTSTLDIRDDGLGMTLDDVKEQFLAVGGSKKFDDQMKVGRIGIGFLAIVPFCEKITIYTKAASERCVVEAVINTNTMLPQDVRYKEIATQEIGTARKLTEHESQDLIHSYGKSFTCFTLTQLRADISRTFAKPADFETFREELRLILPLHWPNGGPLKSMLSSELWDLMKQAASRKAINVFLNNDKTSLTRRVYGENAKRENSLFVKEFRNEVLIKPEEESGQLIPLRITGFFVCDEPSNEKREGTKLNGVITRVLNVAVEEDTYFGLEGKEPRKPRVAGEIFIDGFDGNQAIQINRNAFTETYKPVQMFRFLMSGKMNEFISGIDRIWKAKTILNKEVKRIRNVVDGISGALESIHQSQGDFTQLPRKRTPTLMRHRRLSRFGFSTSAGATRGLEVRGTDDIPATGKAPYRIELEPTVNNEVRGVVYVSNQLLDVAKQTFNVGGTIFELTLVEASRTDPPCGIDLRTQFIVLNESHPLIRSGDKSIIEVVIFLSYAAEMAETPRDLSKQVIDLLTTSRIKN